MGWKIKLDKRAHTTQVFYDDKKLGFVQLLNFKVTAKGVIPEMTLKITDPHLEIEGNVCPICKIANKAW